MDETAGICADCKHAFIQSFDIDKADWEGSEAPEDLGWKSSGDGEILHKVWVRCGHSELRHRSGARRIIVGNITECTGYEKCG